MRNTLNFYSNVNKLDAYIPFRQKENKIEKEVKNSFGHAPQKIGPLTIPRHRPHTSP